MKKKTGMLILLLGVPVFLFIWGKYNLKHHYELPIYYSGEIVDGDTIYHYVSDFRLVNERLDTVSHQSLDSTYYVAAFYNSDCENDCFKMLSQLVKVDEAFKGTENFTVLLFTSDSLGQVQEIRNDFRYSNQVRFMMGNLDDLNSLAEESYFIRSKEENQFENKLVLVDKEKRIRGFYEGTDNGQIDRMLQEIRLLKTQYEER